MTCEDTDAPVCEGATLISCQDGLEVRAGCSEGCVGTVAAVQAHCQVCGDGAVEGTEQCELGVGSCLANCQLTGTCGDGTLQANEECDDNNLNPNDGCDQNCTIEFCGDGVAQTNEGCDPSAPSAPANCRSDCNLQPNGPTCGNDLPDPGEACDDGNTKSGDGCSFDCLAAESCGNGVLDVNETCELLSGNCRSCLQDKTCDNNASEPGELCLLAPAQEASTQGVITASAQAIIPTSGSEGTIFFARKDGGNFIDVIDAQFSPVVPFTITNSPTAQVDFLASGRLNGNDPDQLAVGLLSNGQTILVFFSNLIGFTLSANGSLAIPATNTILQVEMASVNGDANDELIVLTKDGTLGVVPNVSQSLANNIFVEAVTQIKGPARMVVADFNGDNKADVVVASDGDATTEANIQLFLSTSAAATFSFAPSASVAGLGIGSIKFVDLVVSDFDKDNDLDLVAAAKGNTTFTDQLLIVPNIGATTIPLFPDFGAGTPRISSGAVGLKNLITSDINQDGRDELLANGETSSTIVLLDFNGSLGSAAPFAIRARYAIRNRPQELFAPNLSIATSAIFSVFLGGVEALFGER